MLHTITLSYLYTSYHSDFPPVFLNEDPWSGVRGVVGDRGAPWSHDQGVRGAPGDKGATWSHDQADRQRRETGGRGRGSVEFVHPDLKQELNKQGEDPNNPWVWLTSYSRIPLEAIQEFCSATKTYCPPGKEGKKGEEGLPGSPGVKGSVGPVGPPGTKGARGHRGSIGATGPQGVKGVGGKSGLDGRDGLPGEPGLDGVHGRNGLDGLPGLDGIPGTPGR